MKIMLYSYNLFYPFVKILGLLIPFGRKRRKFEQISKDSPSFTNDGIKAIFALEVSSEGELQQVMPLINMGLSRGLNIEILYCSSSVYEKCVKLAENKNIRIKSLPLLTRSIFHSKSSDLKNWITAPTLYFCRYDFFPDLLQLKYQKNINFVLLSAFYKDSFLYKKVYHLFDKIIAATPSDAKSFSKLKGTKVNHMDLRPLIIKERILNASKKLVDLKEFDFNKKNKVLLGNVWPEDLKILNKTIIENNFILIVPHEISKESLKNFHNKMKELNLPINSVRFFMKKGFLCELYSKFTHVYVGGGFGRSIHSVFEPIFSNCLVSVGPKVNRSSEFSISKELVPNRIFIVNNDDEFSNFLKYTDKGESKYLEDYYNYIRVSLMDFFKGCYDHSC